MKLAPDQKLGFADFWKVGGIARTDTLDSVKAKWGQPRQVTLDDGTTLRYDGLSATFRDDKSIQVDFLFYTEEDRAAIARHGDAPLALLGMTCEEAARHLAFTEKVGRYTTCKHYDKNGTFIDVTLLCVKQVDMLVVMWVPIPSDVEPIPDHCGMPRN